MTRMVVQAEEVREGEPRWWYDDEDMAADAVESCDPDMLHTKSAAEWERRYGSVAKFAIVDRPAAPPQPAVAPVRVVDHDDLAAFDLVTDGVRWGVRDTDGGPDGELHWSCCELQARAGFAEHIRVDREIDEAGFTVGQREAHARALRTKGPPQPAASTGGAVDVGAIRRTCDGWLGEFIFRPEWEGDNGGPLVASTVDFESGIYFVPTGSEFNENYPTDDGCTLITDMLDEHVAESLVGVLNAAPALLDEVESLRTTLAARDARIAELTDIIRRALPVVEDFGLIDTRVSPAAYDNRPDVLRDIRAVLADTKET